MVELMLCSMLTLLPDFLFRRFVQGKRLGREITLFSVWYELRWGITLCLILTVLLITVVLYHHPSSTNVTSLFRTISIFPEVGGRVAKVYVDYNQKVKKGDPLFKMDSTRQEAALERARLHVVQVDASMVTAKADVLTAEGKLRKQRERSYRRRTNCGPSPIAAAECRCCRGARDREASDTRGNPAGGRRRAAAARESAETRITTVLPAQKASAEAELAEAQVELDKMTTYAGVNGRVDQFVLRVGDIVQPAPVTRAAGILIPEGAGESGFLQASIRSRRRCSRSAW